MNRESNIADRIVAKTRKADFGDVELYFNVFDFIVTEDGSQMNPDQFQAAKEELSSRSVYSEVERILWRRVQGNRKGLSSIGLKPKR